MPATTTGRAPVFGRMRVWATPAKIERTIVIGRKARPVLTGE